MPVSYIPSAEKVVEQQKSTARKRRRNQNEEIEELGELLPFKPDTGKTLDKISVLRLTSSYIKFQNFMKSAYGGNEKTNRSILTDLLAQAIDGFLLVLAGDATVLYASDSLQSHVGLNPRDVIGHSIHDLVQSEEDSETIRDNLQPKGMDANQYRMFYIRLKSAIASGRGAVSRYNTHMMVQVSGHLKVKPLPQPTSPSDKLEVIPRKPEVIGLIVECRLIEASPSILELSVPQTSFTTTIGLDTMKIVNVETKVKEVLGFDPSDFVGTDMCDFFHPSDSAKLIPCKFLLQRTGYAVSPIFRFMTSSGEWAWVQMEGIVRYGEETGEPQYLEVSVKVVSQVEGKLKYIKQLEFYTNNPKTEPNPLLLHRDPYDDMIPQDPVPQTHEPVVSGMKKAHIPEPVIDTVLHSRELCLSQLPDGLTNVVSGKEEAEKLALQNLEFFSKFDTSQILPEGGLSMFEIGDRVKKLAADQGMSYPPAKADLSPPQSVSTAHSSSPSPLSQPGSVSSVQPSSVSTYAPSPGSNDSPRSIPNLAPSPNSASPPMHSPDSGIDSPTSASSVTVPVANGATDMAGVSASLSFQERAADATYANGHIPFQTTVVKSESQTSPPEFQVAQADSFPPTISPDSVFTPAAPSYSFLPQNTTIPSSFQFGTQQQQQYQQQHLHQQQYQQQYQGQQQYLQQPSPFGDTTEELDQLLQDLTGQPPPPQQQWLLQQQQLQQQIQQQQQVLQQLLQQQQQHQQQLPQPLLYQPTQLPNGHSASLSSSSSSSSPVPSPYTPQSYGSAGPSPLPPQPANAYQNGLMHTTDISTQQNLSFVGSFSLLPQATSSGTQFGVDPSLPLNTEEQRLLQPFQ